MSAGASAEAWRQELRRARPWWRRALDALGLLPDTRTGAAQQAGAVGEQRTAALIDPLRRAGWHIGHDLAIPGSRANIDHLLVPPHARYAIVLDSKLWTRHRGPVTTRGGRLAHGELDIHRSIKSVRDETKAAQAALSIPAVPLIVIHSAPVAPGLVVDGAQVIAADQLLPLLHACARQHWADPGRVQCIAKAAATALPDYCRTEHLMENVMPIVKKTLASLVLAATALLTSACGHSYYRHAYYPTTRHVVVHHVVVHHVVAHHVYVHHRY